jgi:hypothetical protein
MDSAAVVIHMKEAKLSTKLTLIGKSSIDSYLRRDYGLIIIAI